MGSCEVGKMRSWENEKLEMLEDEKLGTAQPLILPSS